MADVSKLKAPDGTVLDIADLECRAELSTGFDYLSGQLALKANASDIPTVNNGKLTIQQNGTNVAEFKANTAEDVTANITVPDISTKVSKSGDTMTGQLKTSYKSSVAMGSYGSSQTTLPNFCNEIRFSSGCTGSVNIGTNFTKGGVTVYATWYNFIYSPHRSGGKNGGAEGDNCNYGTLILSSMTAVTYRTYIIRVSGTSTENYISNVREVWTTDKGHLTIGGTLVVTFNGSGARDVAISNFTGLPGKPTNMMVSCQSASAAFIDYDYDNSSDTTIRLNAVGLTSSGTYQKLNGNYRIGWMAMV